MKFKPGDKVVALCACGSCLPKTGVVHLNLGMIGLARRQDKYRIVNLSEGPSEDQYYEQELLLYVDPVDILKEML